MDKEESDDLNKKYLDAESTRDEEELLFKAEDQPPGMEEWSRYVKLKKEKAPVSLKDSIWATIQSRKKRRQQYLMGLSGLAASIVLFITIAVSYNSINQSNYEEKEALLNEAKAMFSDKKSMPSQQTILYEDDMVIIYIASNNPK